MIRAILPALVLLSIGAIHLLGGSADSERAVQAQLSPARAAVLAAEISAKVESFTLREGESFVAGEVLVRFEDSLARAQVDRASASLNGAKSTLVANKRLQELNAIGQVELELSLAEVAKAEAELAYANAMLAKYQIIAPFSGRVAEQRVREQEFAQVGQALLEVIDDSVPHIEFLAPSSWLSWLRPGQQFEILIDETGSVYPASVQQLGAWVEPVSRSIKVRAVFTDADPAVIAGMSGVARFPLASSIQ